MKTPLPKSTIALGGLCLAITSYIMPNPYAPKQVATLMIKVETTEYKDAMRKAVNGDYNNEYEQMVAVLNVNSLDPVLLAETNHTEADQIQYPLAVNAYETQRTIREMCGLLIFAIGALSLIRVTE